MARWATLLLVIPAVGCIFDRSGLPVSQESNHKDWMVVLVDGMVPTDGPSDRPVHDWLNDAAPDLSIDRSTSVTPITESALNTEWNNAQVPCVDKDGVSNGQQIPIVDKTNAYFIDGNTALQGAGSDTLGWVGGKSSVAIFWDPNACGGEEKPNDSSWDSAGLLVRGATIDGQQRLVLAAGATVKDVNLINLESNGDWQGEFAKPDDSELATSYKQLVNPVGEAKAIIITLGSPQP